MSLRPATRDMVIALVDAVNARRTRTDRSLDGGMASDRNELAWVDDLAAEVQKRYRRVDYNRAFLSELAVEALSRTPPPVDFDASVLFRSTLRADALPTQADLDSTFGQPPVTLFDSDYFIIDAYVWRDSATSIHDHGFDGAFCVASGASVQTSYSFQTMEVVNEGLRLGEMEFQGLERLEPGEYRPIVRGNAMIHSVFHLEHPTVTVCVRSPVSLRGTIQFTYEPPFLGWDPKHTRPSIRRQLQTCAAIFELGGQRDLEEVYRFARAADLRTLFLLSMSAYFAAPTDVCSKILECGRERHPDRIARIGRSIEESGRRRSLFNRRKITKTAELRFLLAVMIATTDPSRVVDEVARAFPGDPIERIGGWVKEFVALEGGDDGDESLDRVAPTLVEEALRGLRGRDLIARVVERHRVDGHEVPASAVRALVAMLPRFPLYASLLR
jgi:hypothetical protein